MNLRRNPLAPLTRLAAVPAVVLPAAALVLGVAMAGPAAAADNGPRDITSLPAKVTMAPGDKVTITLETNVTTGYSWIATGGCCTANDKKVARVSKGVYTAPDNTNGMVGVPGTTSWTVTALRPGKTSITIVTRPPGAQNTMQDEEVGVLKVKVVR